jgi:hypothetical protein
MRCVMEGGFFGALAFGFFGALAGPAICAFPTETNAIISISDCHIRNLVGLRNLPSLFW